MVQLKSGDLSSQRAMACESHVGLTVGWFVYGRVIDGFDVLDAIEKTPVGKKNRPVTDITIKSVTIHANPFADKQG